MNKMDVSSEVASRPARKWAMLLANATALVAVCALSAPSYAQTGPTPSETRNNAANADAEEIVVTGTRITASGYTAPTPTTMIGEEDILRNAEPNVFTTIAQLPSLQGSVGVTQGTNSTSSGQQGLSSFSMRGLGTIRTLTLLDGQRVVGANVTGVPDISLFPQLLIKRVDVVTGGASASYGSDAVGGVVNFVTDTRFEGFKTNVAGGISTYGDNGQFLFQTAVGRSFFDDRLHVQLSGEYDTEDGVEAGGFGEEMANGRDWYRTTTLINRGVTNDGSPQYLNRDHAQAFQYTKYGLIRNGPLQGTAFDANGNPFVFDYGGNGAPARDAAGAVLNCFNFCIGGDLSGNVGIGTTLQSSVERYNAYGRIGYDLDANNEVYFTFNIAQIASSNQPNPGAAKDNLTLQCSNPFVPKSIQDACVANGITSFRYGVSNAILPNILVEPTRQQYRFVVGADGAFDILGSSWRYDGYYEHGENVTDIRVSNITLTPRYNQAIQAVLLNGAIVCASAVARANGCVPINIIGGDTPSAAALEYIAPSNGPFQHTEQTQDVLSANLSGEPFSLWAGPVSVATGYEYRREWYGVVGDAYGNGASSESPYNAQYPVDPVLGVQDNWYAGNYHNGRGSYFVHEAYFEVNVPFLDSEAIGAANLNAAWRGTDYSTSGQLSTWKVGGTWDTPIDGLRFRAVTSRDVRAPNLSELFAAPITTNIPNFTDPRNPLRSITILQSRRGNPDLEPETARNTEWGVVLSNPPWLPGFNFSVDFYDIKIDDVIGALTAQQQVNFCFENIGDTCGSFDIDDPGGRYFVNVQPFNLDSIETNGFDIEASYQFPTPLGLPGDINLRGLATHVDSYLSTSGIPGTTPNENAGENSGNTPDWRVLAVQTWRGEKASLSLQERWFSDGVIGNQYIVCETGTCPVSTSIAPTIDNNTMEGALYIDVSGDYDVSDRLNLYFKVANLLDRDPEPSPQTNTGIDVNPGLYDVIGRMYRVGLRYNF